MKRYRVLTATALMSALSVILTRFASFRVPMGGAEGIRIGLGSLPNVLTGILFGPIFGALSAAIADLIGMALSPMGAFMPQFTLAAALGGSIPGFVFGLFKRDSLKSPGYFVFGISVAAGIILVSCGLTPYFIVTLFGLNLKTVMVPRILTIIEIPLYTVLSKTLYDRLRKVR